MNPWLKPRLPFFLAAAFSVASLTAQTAGVVDTSFHPALGNRKPDTVVALPDGRLYVVGNGMTFSVGNRTQRNLARLNRDGSVDPTFAPGTNLDITTLVAELKAGPGIRYAFLRPDTGEPLSLLLQPDGKMVLYLAYSEPGPRVILRSEVALARLNPDGSRDLAFGTPRGDLDTAVRLVTQRDSTPAELPVVLSDGRFLKILIGLDESRNRIVTLSRIEAMGTRDSSYGDKVVRIDAPAVLQVGIRAENAYRECPPVSDRLGRIYIATYHNYRLFDQSFPGTALQPGATNPKTSLLRLNPDGTPDPAFTPVVLDEVLALRATIQGLVCVQNKWTYGDSGIRPASGSYPLVEGGAMTLSRLNFDGSNDATFRPTTFPAFSPDYGKLTTGSDGSVYLIARGQAGHRGIIRFDPSGTYDADFSAELGDAAPLITDLYPLADGQLLALGSFTSIDGVAQPYLARLTPNTRAGATYLGNLSVRAIAGMGAETQTAGYISAGGGTTVLARAAGPALAQFGVVNPLADPRLALFQGASVVAANDNWNAEPDALIASTASRVNAFPFPVGSRDAALIATGPAGARTAQITGAASAPGVALLELYHAGTAPVSSRSPRFTNLSARASAGSGSETLIAGFTLNGDTARNILIRAAGPALAKFGVPGVLSDPVLTLFKGSAVVARNDQWQERTAEELFRHKEATAATGAFPFEEGSRDSALDVTLGPGQYTAHVTGQGGARGIVLVEIYEVP